MCHAVLRAPASHMVTHVYAYTLHAGSVHHTKEGSPANTMRHILGRKINFTSRSNGATRSLIVWGFFFFFSPFSSFLAGTICFVLGLLRSDVFFEVALLKCKLPLARRCGFCTAFVTGRCTCNVSSYFCLNLTFTVLHCSYVLCFYRRGLCVCMKEYTWVCACVLLALL